MNCLAIFLISMKAQLINTIQPKELLLVRTKSTFADSYAKLLRSKLPGLEVYFPGLNEIIDATKERHIYQLKLKDSLLNNLNFVKVGHREIQVAWLRGLLTLCRNYKLEKNFLNLLK